MLRLFLLSVILTICSSTVYAQTENVWVFGDKAAVDFNSGSPVPFKANLVTNEGSASVCDNTGRLLFYSDGSSVWDRDGNVMPNGTDISPYATTSSTQGTLILPMPDSNKFYVFSLTPFEFSPNNGRLYYTIVDMDLNNGLGDVVPGRKSILIGTRFTEQMVGVTGDRCNVWLLTVSERDSLKAFNITRSGIDMNPVITPIMVSSNSGIYRGIIGGMNVSPDRKKVAIARSNLAMYDFDPYTGTVSNVMPLSIRNEFPEYYSVCFSPDNSKLYAVDGRNVVLHQFDLSSNDSQTIASSRTAVANVGYATPKIAPDQKIYVGSTKNALDVIEFPNLPGAACQYNVNAVPLFPGTSGNLGLPNVVPAFVKTYASSSRTFDACFVTEATLYADTGGSDYIWNDGTLGRSLVVDTPGIYTVVYNTPPCIDHTDTFIVRFNAHLPGTNSYYGCKGDTNARIWSILPPGDTITYRYTWRNSNGIVKGPLQTKIGDTLKNIVSDTYTLQIVAPNGCDTTLQIVVDSPDYQTSFIVDSVICMNVPLNIQNTSTGQFSSWRWTFGDGDTSFMFNPTHSYSREGVYEIKLMANPCMDSAVRTITVEPVPVVNAGNDTLVCYNHLLAFEPIITPASYPYYTLSWSPASALYLSDSNIRNPVFLAKQDQSFNLKVTTPHGCTSDDDITISVRPEHFMIITPQDTSLCRQDTVHIRITGEAVKYNWEPFLWVSDSTVSDPLIYAPSSMTYQLTGTDIYGCRDSQDVKITIHPTALINIPDSVTVYAGDPYQMDPQGNGIYFSWFPLLGLSDPVIANPLVMPEVNTRYYVQAATEWGCTALDSIDVFVSYDAYLDVPNAFTPRTDLNGELKILKRGAVNLKSYRIFNRWGHLMFETSDINKGWDGTLKGKMQPAGVYVYTIEAYMLNGRKITKQGNVTLF